MRILKERLKTQSSKKQYRCFLEIVLEMTSRFPITVSESVQTILHNGYFRERFAEDEIYYHDIPEVWAKTYYWGHNNFWWKQGEERKRYKLPPLKPARKNKLERYMYIKVQGKGQNRFFASERTINELIKGELVGNSYKKLWEIHAINYNEALKKYYNHMGWEPYIEQQ
ncbi:hypothetical protein J2W91_005399 [Paenibacillus amylolyticus]|uniref:Uncharacterized protein n=1 Tax=Paenibacillus amylolyticus TaxID=1451 RepID=A0AAP5LTR2_PAEAM|nr:hypothetical protein [Paenibacillus amylolyticus]MDR6726874.1 hypothetical protein [Paenibacillus amylolyticus]